MNLEKGQYFETHIDYTANPKISSFNTLRLWRALSPFPKA